MFFGLNNFFISLAISIQVASALLIETYHRIAFQVSTNVTSDTIDYETAVTLYHAVH